MPSLTPNPAVCWERSAPGHRPGERLIEGRPYVFDADRLNAHLAEEAVAQAPADLKRLDSSALAQLDYRTTRRLADQPRDPSALALQERIAAERARRGLNGAFLAGARAV